MKLFSVTGVPNAMNLLHLGSYLRAQSVPAWRKCVGLLAVLYVVSPVDLIPDVLPVIGWLGDLGVVGLAVTFVTRDLARFAKRQGPKVQTVTVEPTRRAR